MSATVRVSTPLAPSQDSPRSGPDDTRPRLGLSPTRPQAEAGMRIDPPPSLPCASGSIPDATAAALPPLDPPGVRVRSHGLRVGPRVARLGGRQDRELRQVRDADDHEARLAQPPDQVGGVIGPVAGQELRGAVDLVARDADVALDRDRHPRERRAVARDDGVGGFQSLFGVDLDEGVDDRIERLDAPQRGLDDLARARVAGAHERGGLFGRDERKIVHEARHPSD